MTEKYKIAAIITKTKTSQKYLNLLQHRLDAVRLRRQFFSVHHHKLDKTSFCAGSKCLAKSNTLCAEQDNNPLNGSLDERSLRLIVYDDNGLVL